MKKAIVIGASSGIGRALALILSHNGYQVGLVARRAPLLYDLQKEMPSPSVVKPFDLSQPDQARIHLRDLITQLDGVDLIVISAGIGHLNPTLEWEKEAETIQINVLGVTAMITTALQYFREKKAGHLVVLSSIAGLRGGADGPAYNASKAFQSNYLEGIRCQLAKEKTEIWVTDVRPGLVDTAMAKGKGLFWVQPVEKAASQIYRGIVRKRPVVYVTKRWAWIAFILHILPRWIYEKM